MTIREIFKLGYTRATKGGITVVRKYGAIYREGTPIVGLHSTEGLIRAAERDHGVEEWQPQGRKYFAKRYIVSSSVRVPAGFEGEHGAHCLCDLCHGARPHSNW